MQAADRLTERRTAIFYLQHRYMEVLEKVLERVAQEEAEEREAQARRDRIDAEIRQGIETLRRQWAWEEMQHQARMNMYVQWAAARDFEASLRVINRIPVLNSANRLMMAMERGDVSGFRWATLGIFGELAGLMQGPTSAVLNSLPTVFELPVEAQVAIFLADATRGRWGSAANRDFRVVPQQTCTFGGGARGATVGAMTAPQASGTNRITGGNGGLNGQGGGGVHPPGGGGVHPPSGNGSGGSLPPGGGAPGGPGGDGARLMANSARVQQLRRMQQLEEGARREMLRLQNLLDQTADFAQREAIQQQIESLRNSISVFQRLQGLGN